MAKVEFELNLRGLNELMKSEEMQKALDEYGAAAAGRASSMSGAAYGHRTHVASYVAITNVYPDSAEAARDNFRNNTLMKAIGGQT